MSDTFNWTDELVLEFANKRNELQVHDYHLEQFKASKEPKKEWEIVAFECELEVYTLKDCGFLKPEPEFTNGHDILTLGYGLNPVNECVIHAIRRLSDGHVFERDETINTPQGKNKIKAFNFINGSVMVVLYERGSMYFDFIKKLPAPLFTTVDGKEIHEGNEFWAVYKEDYAISEVQIAHVNSMMLWKGTFLFSTREAAETYIVNNKPCLSVEDVKKACEHLYSNSKDIVINNVIDLVKSKL